MSVGDPDPVRVWSSPGRLAAKYGGKPAAFCSTDDPKCLATGVRDPISHECVPRSNHKFRTKLVVREPLPAFYKEKSKDDEGTTRVVRKVQRAPCYDANSIQKVLETSASSSQGPKWPMGGAPITPEMGAEVRERINRIRIPLRSGEVNNESIRQLIRSGNLEGIEDWDTTSVTDMSELFQNMPGFNRDISRWNTPRRPHRGGGVWFISGSTRL